MSLGPESGSQFQPTVPSNPRWLGPLLGILIICISLLGAFLYVSIDPVSPVDGTSTFPLMTTVVTFTIAA